jgi:hypothetical protein
LHEEAQQWHIGGFGAIANRLTHFRLRRAMAYA